MANLGLDMVSEAERLGLRSSSERDRFIGRLGIADGRLAEPDDEDVTFFDEADPVVDCCCCCLAQAGIGGRPRPGDTAIFLLGCTGVVCWPYAPEDHSLDCGEYTL